MIILNEYLM